MTWVKVSELNRRFATDGWRSAVAERFCAGCGRVVPMLESTIHGKTTFECQAYDCGYRTTALEYEVVRDDGMQETATHIRDAQGQWSRKED